MLYDIYVLFIIFIKSMGGPDHHDHHTEVDPRIKGTPLDFTHKHPVFDIVLDKKGPEFSEIDERRLEYIRKFAGRVEVPDPEVPLNIQGITLVT